MSSKISLAIDRSREAMDAALHRKVNPDMHVRHFRAYGRDASLYYAEGLVSTDFLQHYVLTPLTLLRDARPQEPLAQAVHAAVYNCDVQTARTIPQTRSRSSEGEMPPVGSEKGHTRHPKRSQGTTALQEYINERKEKKVFRRKISYSS